MAVRAKVLGSEVVADTPAELLEFLRLAREQGGAEASPVIGSQDAEKRTRDLEVARTVLKFLNFIAEAGKSGRSVPEIVERLDLGDPTALGPISGAVRRRLEGSGLKKDRVYVIRVRDGEKRWTPGPEISNAIRYVETRLRNGEG